MTGMYATVNEIVERVETVLEGLSFVDPSSEAVGYSLLDRQDQRLHLGLTVTSPTSRNSESVDAVAMDWVHDTITVRLDVHVARTPGQREQRNAAMEHEQRIRDAVRGDHVLQPFDPVWTGTDRTPSPDLAWLQVVQQFRTRRLESITR
jgi:hypothetical protein